jgi:hypothetical protein
VNCIKARAPTNVESLFDVIAEVGGKLHKFALSCDIMGIPFSPYNYNKPKGNSEKETMGNEIKKARVETHGGGNNQQKNERTQCSTCGKYHTGICREDKSNSSSSSSSNQGVTPGKYDKYKGTKDKKRKSQSISNNNDDCAVILNEFVFRLWL